MESSETSSSPAPWPAKQKRPAGGWLAGPPPTIKSAKCLYREERKRERERERVIIDHAQIIYPCMLYVHFAPVKHKAQWGRLIHPLTWFDWSHRDWRLPATKVHVRGLILFGVRKTTRGANLTPPWVGEEYSLTHANHIYACYYMEELHMKFQ